MDSSTTHICFDKSRRRLTWSEKSEEVGADSAASSACVSHARSPAGPTTPSTFTAGVTDEM